MDQRLSLLTLAVADLEASRRLYLEGLGWHEDTYVPGDISLIAVGEHVGLSLWDREASETEVGQPQERAWGGSGYFADPDGFRWEVATNPGPIGQKVLP